MDSINFDLELAYLHFEISRYREYIAGCFFWRDFIRLYWKKASILYLSRKKTLI